MKEELEEEEMHEGETIATNWRPEHHPSLMEIGLQSRESERSSGKSGLYGVHYLNVEYVSPYVTNVQQSMAGPSTATTNGNCITLNLMESNFSERTERMSCEVELRGFKKLLCVVDTPRAPTHRLQSTSSPNRSRPHPPPTLATPPPPPTAPSTTPPPPPPPLSAPTTARCCCRLRPPHPTAADCRRRRPHITAPPRTRTTPTGAGQPRRGTTPPATTLLHRELGPHRASLLPSIEWGSFLYVVSPSSGAFSLQRAALSPQHPFPRQLRPILPFTSVLFTALCRLRLDSTSSPSPPPSSVASPLLPRLSSDTYGLGFTASCTSQPTYDLLSKEGMCYCIMFIGSMVAQWQKLLCMQLEAGFPRVHKLMEFWKICKLLEVWKTYS
ncbi:extensin-like [Triticum dicoccoides]|uniref:extensin-like n=1 Tax=Triticum dicoccoides TaxID=85692 RepID=UPI00188F5939|nr:extensin-like [Triticum dicoccoides]